MTLTFRVLRGAEVEGTLDDLARLRIEVFREWPYLYDGDMTYERNYMASYIGNDRAVLVAAYDGDKIVGAATGAPLAEHEEDFRGAFAGVDLAMSDVFYCAESVLLPDWRGQGAGHAFFDAREAHARALGFSYSAFCSVMRPAEHPLRPADARSHDLFWRKRGYAPMEGVIAQFDWKDVDAETSDEKRLQFWMRAL